GRASYRHPPDGGEPHRQRGQPRPAELGPRESLHRRLRQLPHHRHRQPDADGPGRDAPVGAGHAHAVALSPPRAAPLLPSPPMPITTVASLRTHLQWALELEHSTIPPYLCALYSIPDGSNVA